MKPVDKFGNPIYGRTFQRMLRIGEFLTKCGYRESENKPNLFYLHKTLIACGRSWKAICFADMRGTDIIKIWEETEPLFYVGPENTPRWLKNRVHLEETERFKAADVPYRLSYEAEMFDDESMLRASESDLAELGYVDVSSLSDLMEAENGICVVCGKDFCDDGLFCSEDCKEVFKKQAKEEEEKQYREAIDQWPRCDACNVRVYTVEDSIWIEHHKEYGFPEMRLQHIHHISYEPEATVLLCDRCHAKVRSNDPKYSKYVPVDSRPNKRKYRRVPCSGCARKALVEIGSEDSRPLCYRCRQKEKAAEKGPSHYYSTRNLGRELADKFSDRL